MNNITPISTGRTVNKCSLKDRIAIHDYLKTVLTKDLTGDTWTYKNGLTDQGVADLLAKSLQKPCTDHGVASVRREMFGDLRRGTTANSAEIDELKTMLTRALGELNEHRLRIKTLEVDVAALKLAAKHHR